MAPGAAARPREAHLGTLVDPETGEKLDRALVLLFPGPRSYTGEDLLEFQVTGSPAVVAGVLGGLGKLENFRPAGPGEFSLRAFENGKMDLTEVEGLADLVAAETASQRRRAFQIAGGALRERVESLRSDLVAAMARVEAQIDFSDADDFEDFAGDARAAAAQVEGRIVAALEGSASAEKLRDGFVVAIAGPPNAGKSTLVNRLVRREVAIVSPEPGTTRDVIEAHLELAGLPVILLDTAGLRDSDSAVESEGVRRARARARDADLVLWLSERAADAPPEDLDPARLLRVQTKGDAGAAAVGGWRQISSLSGQGVAELLDEIARIAAERLAPACSALLIRERHRAAFRDAAEALRRCRTLATSDAELIAEDLRVAAHAMERVTGRIGVEDVLGEVFSSLCVGK